MKVINPDAPDEYKYGNDIDYFYNIIIYFMFGN